MGNSRRTISFTVDSEEEKKQIQEFAIKKGFLTAGAMARFALYQYFSRYPKKNGLHVRADATESKIKEVSDLDKYQK